MQPGCAMPPGCARLPRCPMPPWPAQASGAAYAALGRSMNPGPPMPGPPMEAGATHANSAARASSETTSLENPSNKARRAHTAAKTLAANAGATEQRSTDAADARGATPYRRRGRPRSHEIAKSKSEASARQRPASASTTSGS